MLSYEVILPQKSDVCEPYLGTLRDSLQQLRWVASIDGEWFYI